MINIIKVLCMLKLILYYEFLRNTKVVYIPKRICSQFHCVFIAISLLFLISTLTEMTMKFKKFIKKVPITYNILLDGMHIKIIRALISH